MVISIGDGPAMIKAGSGKKKKKPKSIMTLMREMEKIPNSKLNNLEIKYLELYSWLSDENIKEESQMEGIMGRSGDEGRRRALVDNFLAIDPSLKKKMEKDPKIVRVDLLANKLFRSSQLDHVYYTSWVDNKPFHYKGFEIKQIPEYRYKNIELVTADLPSITNVYRGNMRLSTLMAKSEFSEMFRMTIIKENWKKRKALIIPIYLPDLLLPNVAWFTVPGSDPKSKRTVQHKMYKAYAHLFYTPDFLKRDEKQFYYVDSFFSQESLERGVDQAIKKYGGGQ